MRWKAAIVICFLIALPLVFATEDIEIAGISSVRVKRLIATPSTHGVES
jgi:hypothetical protein